LNTLLLDDTRISVGDLKKVMKLGVSFDFANLADVTDYMTAADTNELINVRGLNIGTVSIEDTRANVLAQFNSFKNSAHGTQLGKVHITDRVTDAQYTELQTVFTPKGNATPVPVEIDHVLKTPTSFTISGIGTGDNIINSSDAANQKVTINLVGTGAKEGDIVFVKWDGAEAVASAALTSLDIGIGSIQVGINASLILTQGSIAVYTYIGDGSGNFTNNSASTSLTVDTIAPTATITGFTVDTAVANNPNGTTSDKITFDKSPTLSGTAPTDSTVNIYLNGQLIGPAVLSTKGATAGTWSWKRFCRATTSGMLTMAAATTRDHERRWARSEYRPGGRWRRLEPRDACLRAPRHTHARFGCCRSVRRWVCVR
jgi:hypothetical protein